MADATLPTEQRARMKLREVFRRANSGFMYWNYRRKIGVSISLLGEVKEWFRRWRFEFRTYLTELRRG